jgi:hypothetical protein
LLERVCLSRAIEDGDEYEYEYEDEDGYADGAD